MITARGESMEPLIHDGDALFVDTGDRRLSSRPGLFVLRLDGALLVKRVARIGLGTAHRQRQPRRRRSSRRCAPIARRLSGAWCGWRGR